MIRYGTRVLVLKHAAPSVHILTILLNIMLLN